VLIETFLQLSCLKVLDTILCADSPISLEQHYTDKGEKNIESTVWEPCLDELYEDLQVREARQIDLEIQMKNNPFVKKVQTLRKFKLIEKSETKVHMKITNKTRGVPYCDCFFIEEDWCIVSMPQKVVNSCGLKVSYEIKWLQSTMMRGVIAGQTNSESKAFWEKW